MHTPTLIAGVLAASLVPTAAFAQKPAKDPKPNAGAAALSLDVKPNPVVFGSTVALTGRLTGATPASGVAVTFEQDDTRPYGDSYKPVTGVTATTSTNGSYAFNLKPQKNTQYRAVAKASPAVTSPAKLVLVRPRVGLRVSTQTPRARSLVRFSGIVQPARTGATALVQKRSSTGRFVTVARTTLRATSLTSRSAYSVRVRIRTSGSYRVKLPGTQEFVNGFSRTIAMRVR